MPPKKAELRVPVTDLDELRATIASGGLTAKGGALKDLIALLHDPSMKPGSLKSKEYHAFCEALFMAARVDKQDLASGKNSGNASRARLGLVAVALRDLVAHGLEKLSPKTVKAVVDHILDFLPVPKKPGEHFEPVARHYNLVLITLLNYSANVESLARSDATRWVACLRLFVARISWLLDATDSSEPNRRESPLPNAGHTSSSVSSNPRLRIPSQRTPGQAQLGDITVLVQCLTALLSASNAPCVDHCHQVSVPLLKVLSLPLGFGKLQRAAFAALNCLLLQTAGDDPGFAKDLTKDLLPLMTYWWQPRTMDNDELLSSVRDEMSKTMHAIHPYLDSLIRDTSSAALLREVEDLLDTLWSEYSQRSVHSRLRLDDLLFSPAASPNTYFSTPSFTLRPFSQDAERRWVVLEIMSHLEDIFLRHTKDNSQRPSGEDEQPRKKRRITGSTHRIRQKLLSSELATKLTALQLVPFFLPWNSVSEVDVDSIVEDLIPLISDKQGLLASWAMLAGASCAIWSHDKTETSQAKWKQIWQLAVRSVSLPGTCRAACFLLNAILEAQLIPYYAVADDISNMLTMADVCGPVVLVDSSLVLMHRLSNIRNELAPSAIQKTTSHVIRWVFSTWKPVDPSYASSFAMNTHPTDLINILLSCCGLSALKLAHRSRPVGGPLAQFWTAYDSTLSMTRYLLLLEDDAAFKTRQIPATHLDSINGEVLLDDVTRSSSHNFRSLVLELLYPKLDDFCQAFSPASQSGTRRGADGLVQLSTDRLRSLLTCLVSSTIMLPYLQNLETRIATDINAVLDDLWAKCIQMTLDASESLEALQVILLSVAPYIPPLETTRVERFCRIHTHLIRLCALLSNLINDIQARHLSQQDPDAMEVDAFGSQNSKVQSSSTSVHSPRDKVAMDMSSEAFFESTKMRLHLLAQYSKNPESIGLVPDLVVDNMLALTDDKFLLCGDFLQELLKSDFGNVINYAADIIEQIGGILKQHGFSTCEAVWCICIDVLASLAPIWSMEGGDRDLTSPFIDLYNFLTKTAWPTNILSPQAQSSLISLLYRLMEINSQIHLDKSAKVDPPQKTLLSILLESRLALKFYIGSRATEFFELHAVNAHDVVFIEILHALPNDADNIEGIAFRISILAQLGCSCPTLLRRCVYHMLEVPGKIADTEQYAAYGMKMVAAARSLSSPKELFRLFAPQLLYTWLNEPLGKDSTGQIERNSIEDIPYSIFDFNSLEELLTYAQTEAAAITIMHSHVAVQERAFDSLATRLQLPAGEIIKNGFSKILAYSIGYICEGGDNSGAAEARVRKILGKEAFYSCLYDNFVDIVGLFFVLADQESLVENAWRRIEGLTKAAETMEAIKKCGHSATQLPPNQQPCFKAKRLPQQIAYLTSKTRYDAQTLWTPALVASVARRLLNIIHPALGPHHALAVVRKIRVLISLAGPSATHRYPLEMLLRSMMPFISEPECADDAIGICQWLITNGASHLAKVPSFLAGYALSTLASLRMFLESSQSSTTQESQFKSTIGKAQQFHASFVGRLEEYDSRYFKSDKQREAFKAIVLSASNIRSSGNSETQTPESKLLLEILKDAEQEDRLLNDSARDIALRMLCGDFRVSDSPRNDILQSDQDACTHGPMVWKSCQAVDSSNEYFTWAGRVVGRSFAASGDVPHEVLRESLLSTYFKTAMQNGDSVHGLLRLLSNLTMSDDSSYAGFAESAVRMIVSLAAAHEDQDLMKDCRQSMPETLYESSNWAPYLTPMTDQGQGGYITGQDGLEQLEIQSPSWAKHLALMLIVSAQENVILSSLSSILTHVDGFAEQALPYIVHSVLLEEFDSKRVVRQNLLAAAKEWLTSTAPEATGNIKLMMNVVLYLRSRPYPNETSINDRARWLDLENSIMAEAAARCGMFKVALMFAELATSEASRTSRRSSASRETNDPSDLLLSIFENIDDPDAYYGLERTASLSNVLARLEYENEGSKSLAFRGAQYDSHIRNRDLASEQDEQSLVKILSGLGLAGLSDSLLQAQQHHDNSLISLDSTFTTARRLEKWNLPAPPAIENPSATSYRAYQSIYKAFELAPAKLAIRDGLAGTMRRLVSKSLKGSELRQHLATLAALSELDDVLGVSDSGELERIFADFEARSKWMMSARYDDVSQILSHRQTTLSMLSQKDALRTANVTSLEARLVEVRSLLLSSNIYRFHQARQEALSISTSLRDLVISSEHIGLNIDAAVKVDEAHSLWDYGEMISSIRLLQGLHSSASSFKKQSIPVSHADILSKIGHQVSVAKLETVDSIQKKYLEPALKMLKGERKGKEAGQVYHQFATFCDEQLQNPEMLEDLARLQRLVSNKAEEVNHYRNELGKAANSQQKVQYMRHMDNAQKYLKLDQDEFELAQKTRNEFVRLSLENYLQSLIASDDHDNDALRFTALWLERSESAVANMAVNAHLREVPSHKFAPLMNQLSSRLQLDNSTFQKYLYDLVFRVCCDHPYHGIHQIWAGGNAKPAEGDQTAVLRKDAARKMSAQLLQQKEGGTSEKWRSIDSTNTHYHALAREKPTNQKRLNVRDSAAATRLAASISKWRVPPPTLEIELTSTKDYSRVPTITKLEPTMSIAGGVSAPKILTVVLSTGERHKQLVKGGNDDLRQDAIMEQVFAAVSSLLKQHRSTRQRNLAIRTYKVMPLTARSGLMEFVANTEPLHEWLMPAHERYNPKDTRPSHCRKQINDVQRDSLNVRISTYRRVTERFHPVMRYFFLESYPDPDEWYVRRLAYIRSTAAISILGHVLGLGDRHGHNILLDKKTGEVVHIDLGVAFETGRILPIPEMVPFRMTRDIVDGMGVTKTDGVFRRCCEFTLDALREDTYSIMTILDVLRYDPLYSWSSTPMRLAKLQRVAEEEASGGEGGLTTLAGEAVVDGGNNKKKAVNEPSEADRALEVVRKKLSKTLSVTAMVNDLINQATDERNLAVLYSGWAAYA